MQNRNLSFIIEEKMEEMKEEWFNEVKKSEFMKS